MRIGISLFVLIGCIFLIIYAQSNLTPKTVYVSGYTKKDGTRVSSYYRRPPGSVEHDSPYETIKYLSIFAIVADGIFFYASCKKYKDEEYQNTKPPRQEVFPIAKIDNFREQDSILGHVSKRIADDIGSISDSPKILKEPNDPVIIIKYSDNYGRITKRQIKIKHIQSHSKDYYITAYCYLRNADRAFKLSGIKELTINGKIRNASCLLSSFYDTGNNIYGPL
jgi:hypothetical protein